MQTYSKEKHKLGFYQVCPIPSKEELEHYYKDTYYQERAEIYSTEELQFINNRAIIAEKIWMDFSDKKNGKLFNSQFNLKPHTQPPFNSGL